MTAGPFMKRTTVIAVLIGIVLTIAVAVLFRRTTLDIDLQALAYSPVEPSWPFADRQPWRLLHEAGTIPGLLFAVGATVLLAASFGSERYAPMRYRFLYILLLMALGPGLVTNLLGKELCGRPRPLEIVQFGGSLAFHKPFELGTPGRGFSFLCGHCSMGFLFFALFFLWRGGKRRAALAFAIGFGLIIGIGRVVQAAHFPSDVLLDGTIMFTLAAALSPIAELTPNIERRWSGAQIAAATAVTLVLLIGAFLFSTPVRKESTYTWLANPRVRRPQTRETLYRWTGPSTLVIDVQKGDIAIDVAPRHEPLHIEGVVTGYGFPGADTRTTIAQRGTTLTFTERLRGSYWESHGHYVVTIDDRTGTRVIARTADGRVFNVREASPRTGPSSDRTRAGPR